MIRLLTAELGNPRDAADHYPWTVKLLPFIEEEALYKDIRQASQGFKLPAQQVRIPIQMITTRQIFSRRSDFDESVSIAACQRDTSARNLNYVVLTSTRQPLLTDGTPKLELG